jgi:predicted AlkP superfamily pyrophosphatase or phosphodiesterase
MKPRDRLPLFVFIDALGWEILTRHPFFLEGVVRERRRLRTILGYSSACDPSIISGVMPSEHGLWSSWFYAPGGSPFRWLAPLRFLPRGLTDRARVRSLLSRTVKRLHGFTGYFQLYNVPFGRIGRFDYAEKRRIWDPGGLAPVRTVFDELAARGCPYSVHDSSDPDTVRLARLEERIRCRDIGFAYISLGGLDALMHQVGTHDPQVTEKVRWYDARIRALRDLARANYGEAPLYVFTDHGMHDVREAHDLQADLARLGLEEGKDFVVFLDATMARFWFLREGARSRVLAALDGHSKGRWLSDDDLRHEGVFFADHRYGEAVFLMNPGIQIAPSHMGAKPNRGMHGFDPEDADSWAAISSDRSLPEGLERIAQIHSLLMSETTLVNGKDC